MPIQPLRFAPTPSPTPPGTPALVPSDVQAMAPHGHDAYLESSGDFDVYRFRPAAPEPRPMAAARAFASPVMVTLRHSGVVAVGVGTALVISGTALGRCDYVHAGAWSLVTGVLATFVGDLHPRPAQR